LHYFAIGIAAGTFCVLHPVFTQPRKRAEQEKMLWKVAHLREPPSGALSGFNHLGADYDANKQLVLTDQ
jgi:hypothetical protein